MKCVFCGQKCGGMKRLVRHLIGKNQCRESVEAGLRSWEFFDSRIKCFCGEEFHWFYLTDNDMDEAEKFTKHLEEHGGLEIHYWAHLLGVDQ
jgi:hypothetical protein